jgi:hypothetical protein
VDFAPIAEYGEDFDLDGVERDWDLELKPNASAGAVRDLGAYERQSIDPLVLNGNFDADLNLWTNLAPAKATVEQSRCRRLRQFRSLRGERDEPAVLTVTP